MNILCIDIGNTTTRYGLVEDGRVRRSGNTPTASLDEQGHGLDGLMEEFRATSASLDGLAFCSVVPEATKGLMALIETRGLQPVFQLTCDNCPQLAISYPKPEEIGQDRLANAIGALALYKPPIVIIDLGTAVTFDVVTRKGYEGGIIAPGIQMISRCMHEQTALLPEVNMDEPSVFAAFGKSTEEAIKVGCSVGFKGMVQALYEGLREELAKREEGMVTVVATGGDAGALPENWLPDLVRNPHLTLLGLAMAFERDKSA